MSKDQKPDVPPAPAKLEMGDRSASAPTGGQDAPPGGARLRLGGRPAAPIRPLEAGGTPAPPPVAPFGGGAGTNGNVPPVAPKDANTPVVPPRDRTATWAVVGILMAVLLTVGFGLVKGRPPVDAEPAAAPVETVAKAEPAPEPVVAKPAPPAPAVPSPPKVEAKVENADPPPTPAAAVPKLEPAKSPPAPSPAAVAKAEPAKPAATVSTAAPAPRIPSAVPVSQGACKTSCALEEVDGKHLVTCSYGQWWAGELTPNKSGQLKGCLSASKLTLPAANGS